MKVTGIETLHCDAGWRNYSFVKLTTDEGIVGWSEYDEGFGSPGVTAAIEHLAERVVGQDVSAHERIYAELYCVTRPAAGGVVAEAMGAIENALLDAKAKAARRAVLRAARRQAARPHPALLVALRHVAHQPSRLVQASDHRPRRRQGDRPRGAREGFRRAQDQHLHLRERPAAAAGGRASGGRSIPSSTSTRRCCGICACTSRRSTTAPGRTSICCSISISTPRPKAI